MLDTVPLGNTGRTTTRLGFGCSSIMGSLGRRESLAVLEAAWDAGIRHFDVAPLYGYGEAERCLGDFIHHHKGGLTVTTKFGIPPATISPLARIARSAVRQVISRFPGLKQGLSKGAQHTTASAFPPIDVPSTPKPPNPIFCVREAKKALHNSLSALKSDHIDVWLMHEVAPADLSNDDLLRFLEDSVRSGIIGTFGAGTDRNQVDELLRLHPPYCPTLQYEWSIFNSLPKTSPVFRMHHRSLTNNFRSLHAALLLDNHRCVRWSQLTGADIADAAVLAKLMLKAALLLNPESVILFSSKNAHHIEANVALASDNSLSAAALALYRVVQSELFESI